MKNRQIKLDSWQYIKTYFASGIYTSGLPLTTNHRHVILLFTYIIPPITQNDPTV